MMNLQTIVDALLRTPYAKVNDESHIYVRCPLCGDSLKHKDGAHCGIWIQPGQPLIYHCWICEESGIVNTSFLQSLGITNSNIINLTSQFNHAGMKGMKLNTNFKAKKKDWKVNIPAIQDTSMNREKLKYMQERLGIPFTYRSLEVLRVIFNLQDFLELNGLRINQKYSKQQYYLNRDYIGFLSTTKDMITFRNIRSDKFRYVKYPVFENNPFAMQMYTLPSQVGIFEPEVHLHIAEGPFDILGVFFHIMNGNLKNSIYTSVGGSAYKRTLQYFLHKGFLTNLIVHIYSDQDKPLRFYKPLVNEYQGWVKEFHIYYNELSKDTGVPKDMIQEVESIC